MKLLLLFIAQFSLLPLGYAADSRPPGGVWERTVLIPGEPKRNITFLMKPPAGARNGNDIKGVVAFCTWRDSPEAIKHQILTGAGIGPLAQLARDQSLALIAWTTYADAKAFDKTRNFDEMTRSEALAMERNFDTIARTWRRGVEGICQDYQLPTQGWLLYGMSRGAQWAHRLALREPELFGAVHIHINSSYDEPTPDGAKVAWLVTTGELEAGYPSARKFYAAARSLNYPIIFHGEPRLGHENNANIDRLSRTFFQWWLRRKQAGAESPRFVGNYSTHEFFPLQAAKAVPEPLRVYLPNREIAEAWGLSGEEPLRAR